VTGLAVVILVVLAGCGGVTVGPTDTQAGRTVTPAPVPTDPPDAVPLPPGVSTGGVTDAERLENAHLTTLSNATFLERGRTTVRLENGSLAIEETYVGRHGTNATATRQRRNGTVEYGVPSRSLVEADIWGNGSFGARRFVTTDGRVELEAFDSPVITYTLPRRGYGLTLRNAETTLESQRVANGSVEYVLLASNVDVRGPWYYRGSFMELREVGRARVAVTPEGTIRRFVVEFPIRIDGRNATLRHTYVVEFGDVTVTRPLWFGEAVETREPTPFALATRSDQPGPGSPARGRYDSRVPAIVSLPVGSVP
jgi:hypothetical protein